MTETPFQHQTEILRNRKVWDRKPLLRAVYAGFHRRLATLVRPGLPGRIVEIGCGIGQLRQTMPEVLLTDQFAHPWVDLVCTAYRLPFDEGTISHLILFDVFHHLSRPFAFLREARRVVCPGGKVLLFEPYLSAFSWPVYGLLHPEAVGWRQPIEETVASPAAGTDYYAAQGNATRLFFRNSQRFAGWRVVHREVLASWVYVLSGGFSRPALVPAGWLVALDRIDRLLSRWPGLFGTRCLVGLEAVV